MQWNIIRYLKGRKGTSLVVQWLRLCTSNVEARVQSLVKELRPPLAAVNPELCNY